MPKKSSDKKQKVSKADKSGKSNFLLSTYKMIEQENEGGLIKWNSTGDSFIIENNESFVKILPKYFKTKNYSSFVRQLNMYDFHKIKNLDGFNEFKHPQFKRGNLKGLHEIKRKVNEYSEIVD